MASPTTSSLRWLLLAGPLAASMLAVAVGWKRGIEHPRVADQGDGSGLDPVPAGDHPHPSCHPRERRPNPGTWSDQARRACKPAPSAAGNGKVHFRQFRCRALEGT